MTEISIQTNNKKILEIKKPPVGFSRNPRGFSSFSQRHGHFRFILLQNWFKPEGLGYKWSKTSMGYKNLESVAPYS